jgi:hypothetical protein
MKAQWFAKLTMKKVVARFAGLKRHPHPGFAHLLPQAGEGWKRERLNSRKAERAPV